MAIKNLIRSALTVRGRSGRSNRAASHRGIRLAPLLLVAVMLAVLAETSNPARTVHAQNYGNVVCSGDCPTYDDVPAEITIWSATLTVGTQTIFGQTVYGWTSGGSYHGADLTDTTFSYGGTNFTTDKIQIAVTGQLEFSVTDTGLGDDATNLVLHVGTQEFPFADAIYVAGTQTYRWSGNVPTWAESDSVQLKITTPPPPNAYGYRTIWTALMTAETSSGVTGYTGSGSNKRGKLTNDTIVDGRDETITIGTGDQPQFPWTGYVVAAVTNLNNETSIRFASGSSPTPVEVAGWTLTLGGGVELPFADATYNVAFPETWLFSHDPNWTDGQQVVVSIRNDEVQNRIGKVDFKSRRSNIRVNQTTGNIVYGKTHFAYDLSNGGKFGPGNTWELRRLNVTTDKTGDTDPVWITATFRAHSDGNAGRAYQGYWEGEFEDFHTLFLRWVYSVDGAFKGGTTYTLPLRAAAKEGGISYRAPYDGRPDNYYVSEGHDVSFTWVRTYKEFKDKHLDLANHANFSAHMLAPPQPATARAGGDTGDCPNCAVSVVPTTVTSVEFTSNPGSDQVYGPGSTIQVTVAFSEDVTVSYVGAKKHAAELDLEMGGQTRTAYYARTDGNKVIFEYTVVPGDEAPFALLLSPNSLRLDVSVSETNNWERRSWIRDSEGRDAVLDHDGLADTGHRVDTVWPRLRQRPGLDRRRPGGGHLRREHPVSGDPESLRRADESPPEPDAGRLGGRGAGRSQRRRGVRRHGHRDGGGANHPGADRDRILRQPLRRDG